MMAGQRLDSVMELRKKATVWWFLVGISGGPR